MWKKFLIKSFAGFLIVGTLTGAYAYAYPDSFFRLFEMKYLMEYPPAAACATCHWDIYADWQLSRHRKSWSSQKYAEATRQGVIRECIPCHTPVSVEAGKQPSARVIRQNEGVECVPCHMVRGAMMGPYDSFSPPHPSRKNDSYRKSEFCAVCHKKALDEWEKTGTKEQCQDCHMPRKKDRAVQKFFLQVFHPIVEIGDHKFPEQQVKPADLAISYKHTPKQLVMTIENKNVPHGIPTGEHGDPRVYVRAKFMNASGELLSESVEVFGSMLGNSLQYREPQTIRFARPRGAVSAGVSIYSHPTWTRTITNIHQDKVELE